MVNTCFACSKDNAPEALSCLHCGAPLSFSFQDFQELKKEILGIRMESDKRLRELERRLQYMEAFFVAQQKASEENSAEAPKPSVAPVQTDIPSSEEEKQTLCEEPSLAPKRVSEEDEHLSVSPEKLEERERHQPSPMVASDARRRQKKSWSEWQAESENGNKSEEDAVPNSGQSKSSIAAPAPRPAQKKQKKQRKAGEQSAFERFFTEVLFAPFAGIFSYARRTHAHYKAENKLPIFFMTLSGIVAILLGVGYLLQYSISNYFVHFSEWTKAGIGFACSSALLAWAIHLCRKAEKFKEFGSAMMGLAVILNYMLIWFLSAVDTTGSFSAVAGFWLIVANTGLAMGLALKFETRIVAVLSLLGGAYAPFLLSGGQVTPFYFLYLFFLTIASLFLAKRIRWKELEIVSFFVAQSVIEVAVFKYDGVLSCVWYTLLFHGFAYLFVGTVLFNGKRIKKTLKETELGLLAANLGLFGLNLYWVHSENLTLLGILYALNALPFLAGIIVGRKSMEAQMKLFFFVVVGAMMALAVPFLVSLELLGPVWAVQALALLWSGFIFKLPKVRREALMLMLIALGKIIYSFIEIAGSWDSALLGAGYGNLLFVGVILGSLHFLMHRNEIDSFEQRIFKIVQEVWAFWGLAVFFVTLGYHFEEWVCNLAIIPLFTLIWWGNRQKLKVTEALGWIMIFPILLGFIFSVDEVNSARFANQTLAGKLALLEVGFCLWFLQFFYQKVLGKDGFKSQMAYYLRELFYWVLPLILIRIVFRLAPDFVLVAGWMGVLIAFVLHHLTKRKSLMVEGYLLTYATTIFCFGQFVMEDISFAGICLGLCSGLAVLGGIFAWQKGYEKEQAISSPFKSLFVYFILYSIIVAGLFMAKVMGDLSTGLAVVAVLSLGLSALWRNIHVVRGIYLFLHGLGMVMMTLVTLLLLVQIKFLGIPNPLILVLVLAGLGMAGYYLLQPKVLYLKRAYGPRWVNDMYWWNLLLLGFYVALFNQSSFGLSSPFLTIILVLHAIGLLFGTMWNEFRHLRGGYILLFVVAFGKLFLHDLADYSMVEKVIAFILIGVVFLGAAYGFVKLKDGMEKEK